MICWHLYLRTLSTLILSLLSSRCILAVASHSSIIANTRDVRKRASDVTRVLWLIERWRRKSISIKLRLVKRPKVFAILAIVGPAEAVKADLPRVRKWNHLIPLCREISVRGRPQDFVAIDVLPAFLFGLVRDSLHAHGRHKVAVALRGGVDLDLFEMALSVMATARIPHLSNCFDHSGDANRSEVLWIVVGELLGDANRSEVLWIVVGELLGDAGFVVQEVCLVQGFACCFGDFHGFDVCSVLRDSYQ